MISFRISRNLPLLPSVVAVCNAIKKKVTIFLFLSFQVGKVNLDISGERI